MSGMSLSRLENRGALDMPDECEIHQGEFTFGGWHLHHGWAHCGVCGATYCIVDYDGDEQYDGAELQLKDKFVEAMQDFYDEHEVRFDENPDLFDEFINENYPELA